MKFTQTVAFLIAAANALNIRPHAISADMSSTFAQNPINVAHAEEHHDVDHNHWAARIYTVSWSSGETD